MAGGARAPALPRGAQATQRVLSLGLTSSLGLVVCLPDRHPVQGRYQTKTDVDEHGVCFGDDEGDQYGGYTQGRYNGFVQHGYSFRIRYLRFGRWLSYKTQNLSVISAQSVVFHLITSSTCQ